MLVQTKRCLRLPGATLGWLTRRLAHPAGPENEISAAPIGIVGASGGLAGLVLPLSKCLVNRDSESDRVFLGEGLFLR